MKKSAWKIVWIVGVYAILVSVLYLVVLYKVKWEDRDLNTYLYFYNCSNNLCTTTTKPNKYYSSVVCKDKVCPYISSMNDNLLVLTTEDKDYVFDYINNKKIHEEYTRYKFTDNKYLIATDTEGKQGIISSVGEVVVPFKYKSILNYKDGFVSYISNSRVGIDNDEDNTHIEPKYENVVLLTPTAYAYLNNSVYHIVSYDNETPINDNEYDYIYAYNNTILVFRNKQLDILNESFNSQLLMKINTLYDYKIEKDREGLNIHVEGSLLHFDIFNGNGYNHYVYDTKNNKIYEI